MAAWALTCAGQPVTQEALIVAAWQRVPRSWGLKGGYQGYYPDSAAIVAALSRRRGRFGIIHGRRWLQRIGPKLYCVTAAGQEQVERLRGEVV
jgi:hypothetical protein